MCVTNERGSQRDGETEKVCVKMMLMCVMRRESVCVCEDVADDVCDAHVCMRRCMGW